MDSVDMFKFDTHELRVYGSVDEPLFPARDVCRILGYDNVSNTTKKVPEEFVKKASNS
jgi:prophage antirepressor-like protein